MKLDDKDLKILTILKENARTPNVEIAKTVGLTEGAVRHRIDNLVSKGTIERFTITTSGAAYFGVVMLKARGETKKMMADVAKLDVTRDAYEISGEHDGCVILEGNTLEEVDGKIDRIRKLKAVKETRTFISFKRW